MTDKFISIEAVSKRFPAPGGGHTTVFEDLWLSMARGEFVCIIGHSGCGKTTVLNILAGLDEPSDGAVIVDNKSIEGPSLDRAVIFQSHALLPWLTVMGNVAYAVSSRWRSMRKDKLRAQAQKFIDLHRHPLYYGVRNHIIDFLVSRSKNFADEIQRTNYARRQVPVVRPGAPEPVVAAESAAAAPSWSGLVQHRA